VIPSAPALPATGATYEQVPAPAASSARPTAPASPATAPADSGPVKTFSDKPADAPAPVADGWKASEYGRGTAAQATQPEAYRAEKPAADADAGTALRRIESIPSPAASEPAASIPAEKAPTVAPVGPSVDPAPPAHDPRDIPAAGTSGRGVLKPITADHTT
jgi:hypothetical protein